MANGFSGVIDFFSAQPPKEMGRIEVELAAVLCVPRISLYHPVRLHRGTWLYSPYGVVVDNM